MKTFFDSSAFAKRFIKETGSDIVEGICEQSSSLGLSVISIPEIISALCRRQREGFIRDNDYALAKTSLLHDVEDVDIINITGKVVQNCIDLLEKNPLRTMDALHIACALEWETDVFVSSDQRQIEAAERAGLVIRFV